MRIAISLCVFSTACVTTETPEVPSPREPYDLVKTKAIAGELPVVGLDGDGSGGLWLAYYFDEQTRIVHLDPDGDKLVEHVWAAGEGRASGLALDGDSLWINVRDGGSLSGRTLELRQIDAATGTTLRTLPESRDVIDIDVFGDELRLGLFDGRAVGLERASGVQRWENRLVPWNGAANTARGFTTDDDGAMWMMSLGYWLEKYTPAFEGAGVFTGAPFEGHHTTDFDVFLAWDGGLIAATENQISWLVPRGDL